MPPVVLPRGRREIGVPRGHDRQVLAFSCFSPVVDCVPTSFNGHQFLDYHLRWETVVSLAGIPAVFVISSRDLSDMSSSMYRWSLLFKHSP